MLTSGGRYGLRLKIVIPRYVSHRLKSPKAAGSRPSVFLKYRYFSSTGEGKSFHALSVSVYDKSNDWRDWFKSSEYVNAWSDDIEPLDNAQVLDGQSRMVLDLLNKMYQIGLTKTTDRVTTERVHTLLQQLEDIPLQTSESMWQRAERGRVLLEAMEKYEDLRDERHLPLPIPLPTHETYWRVLRMYSNKFLSGYKAQQHNVPALCHAMVQRMQESGRLELQPTAIHWNQVLSAYANSSSDERPVQAVTLLYELEKKGMTDASSFSHALRACSALIARNERSTPKFVEASLPIAQRIWAGLKKSEFIDIQSFHFTHMLRVFRNVHDEAKRDKFAETTFNEAIEARKINIHVLNEFLQVASPDLASRVLGKASHATNVEAMIREVPSEWIEPVVKGGKSPYEW